MKQHEQVSREKPGYEFAQTVKQTGTVQYKGYEARTSYPQAPVQRVANHTGLPDELKTGVENLSGYSMDDVQVYYNSNKPATLGALAYAQGTDIHIAPGQEEHLPHEAWHVAQQKQGRVAATRQLKGNVAVNDDKGLENEADKMGARATTILTSQATTASRVFQRSGDQPIAFQQEMPRIKNDTRQFTVEPLGQSLLHSNGKVIQCEKPSTNLDPAKIVGASKGISWNRKKTINVLGEAVPSQITAIMKQPPVGGVPSIAPPGWNWLQKKIGRLKGQWVRFHIINRLLGGPGNKSWNLVPTSVAVNNMFSNFFEKDAKENAIDDKEWTYIDVNLQYDTNWPAPIPTGIDADWGERDATNKRWVRKDSISLTNYDITNIGAGFAYLRGANITQGQLKKRSVPSSYLKEFTDWLQDYTTTNDDDDTLLDDAENEFPGEPTETWLDQVWLDEDDIHPGNYVAVVKAK